MSQTEEMLSGYDSNSPVGGHPTSNEEMNKIQMKWESQMQQMQDMFLKKFDKLKQKNKVLFKQAMVKHMESAKKEDVSISVGKINPELEMSAQM